MAVHACVETINMDTVSGNAHGASIDVPIVTVNARDEARHARRVTRSTDRMARWANRATTSARSVTTDDYGETGDADTAPGGARNEAVDAGDKAISADDAPSCGVGVAPDVDNASPFALSEAALPGRAFPGSAGVSPALSGGIGGTPAFVDALR